MDQKTIDKFRQALTEHKDTLSEWLHLDDTKRSINLGDASDNDVSDFITEIQEMIVVIGDQGTAGGTELQDLKEINPFMQYIHGHAPVGVKRYSLVCIAGITVQFVYTVK